MKNIAISFFILFSFSLKAQTLNDYFKIAAENNPGLQASYKGFEAAMQKIDQVSTLPDPTISFGYFVSPAETRVGPQNAKISLTQMFPWFGTLKLQGDASSLMAEAKYQAFLDARNKLYYQVAASYYPLYELNRWKQIEQENIYILQSYKTTVTKKFENSQSSMVDVLRVDIMLKDANTDLQILSDKEKPLTTSFNKLLNRDVIEKVLVLDSLPLGDVSDNFRRDSLFANNPNLNELDLKIQSSKTLEQVAIKQGLPKFGLGLDYVLVGERSDVTMPDNGKDIFMPMVSVSIPIFRGKYSASKKEAQLMQESYTFQKEELKNSLESGYDMVWFDIQKQKELFDLYDKQIIETKQALNLLFTAYANSGKEFEEVLRMQQMLLKYEKMKASAEVQFQISLAKLNYLTSKTY